MALDLLLEAIAQEGDAEARKLVDAARVEAAAIRKAADARAERRCAEALASRETAIRAELDARRALAVREARSRVLAARSAFIDRILGATEQSLPGALEAPSSAGALQRLTGEALACFDGDAVRIRCRSGLAAALRGDANSSGSIHIVADDTVPEGVVAETLDGSCRVDNTLVARLRRYRPALSIALVGAVPPRGPA